MTAAKQPAADLTPAFRMLPPAVPALFGRRPGLFLWLRVALLLGLFVALDYVIARAAHLPAQSYGRPYLFLELLARLGALKLILVLIVLAVLARYGRLLQPWGALEFGGRLRWFIVFLAALLAWPFSTYGYNFYFDQGHYADRTLLVVLLALVWLRPVFIYPFVLLVYAVMWQLAEPVPIGGSVFAHKLQLLHVLNLFAAAFLLYAATGWNKTRDFLFLTCCLVAAAYWEAGLTKLKIDWLSYGHLYRLPLAAYAHGWLGFLDSEAVLGLARLLVWLDWPMRLIVLAIELGCLFFLWRRSLSAALLVAVVIFHAGVFVLYGFLFWTWMLLDLALLVLLLRERRVERLGIYGRPQLWLSVLLIAAAGLWARPPQLGWFDTRLSYTYRFEAVGASGRHYPLPAQFFAPYEDAFTIAAFGYLIAQHGVLTGPYAVIKSRALAERIDAATTPEEVFALERQVGASRYDPERAERFCRFLTRFVANRNARGATAEVLYALHPPRQLWSYTPPGSYTGQEPIRQVIVKEITTLFDERRFEVIRELELKRLIIPPA